MGDLGPEERRKLDRMPDWVKSEVTVGQILNDIMAVVSGRANPMEIAKKWADKLTKFEQDSIRDPLTGAWNRGYIAASMSREMAIAKKYNTNLGLLFMDIDHFKEVNDQEPDGHAAGDRTLKEIVKMLNEDNPDRINMVGRWGGEELVVVIPDCDGEKLKQTGVSIGHKVREGLAGRARLVNHTRVTVSIGAGLAGGEEDVTGFIDRVDGLMYKAKQGGRDRMVVAGETEEMIEFGS